MTRSEKVSLKIIRMKLKLGKALFRSQFVVQRGNDVEVKAEKAYEAVMNMPIRPCVLCGLKRVVKYWNESVSLY